MKIDLSIVSAALRADASIPPATARRLIEQLNAKAATVPKADPVPRAKMQTVILLSDPAGKLVYPDEGVVGWVVQLDETEHPSTTLPRIKAAAAAFNNSRKGRLVPVNTIGEALESVPSKWFKDEDTGIKVAVKTKVPCAVFTTDGRL